MDLLTQLNRAVSYIEANITDDDALAKVASVTLYSPYHFQRIFNYIADMPLNEYIRRRKLSLAAVDLQSSDVKVIDIAMKYGYDSADGFTRAFQRQHGVTPSEARQSGVSTQIYLPLTFQIQIKGVRKMDWRIEEREAFEVFGIERVFGKNETDTVPGFWDELLANGE
jgi:AraC family transcriptional regulator